MTIAADLDRTAAAAVDAADAHPLVERVKRYSLDVLAPAVLTTDSERVAATTIEDLRRLGALNHLAPTEFGGADLDRYADRRLHELLAYADLNTWLIWAQHAPTVARIARVQEDTGRAGHPLIGAVLRGERLVGAGISDVRRYPDGHLVARRDTAGWVVDGTISWFSGWGLNDVALLAAVEPDTQSVVLGLIPIDHHFSASPLDLRAVYGSRTERVEVRAAPIPVDHVLDVQPLARWQHADISTASNAGSQFFGLGRRILDELAREPLADDGVARWSPYLSELRDRAYQLADEALDSGDPDVHLAERLELKVRAGEALTSLGRALVVARAGRGLPADNTAQLHARSALFLQVQGQTRTVRAAQLARIATAVPTLH